jgi:O-antigen biosynthesis alpha-1,2-mannosyltransferase
MRIVIDMQGAQTESRFRGIGRYTLSLAQAIARHRGKHEVFLALSGLFPETIEPIRAAFAGLLPQENMPVWHAPRPVREMEPGNTGRREVAELIREAFFASLKPDVIHISSLFEGYVDDAVTSLGRFDRITPASVTIYDLIPLLNPEHYLKHNAPYHAHYLRKVAHVKRASVLLAISESSRQEAITHLNAPSGIVVNCSVGADIHFRPLELSEADTTVWEAKYGITRPFIFYTGGADERKNLPRLIQAYARLSPVLRQAHQLVLAGKIGDGDLAHLRHAAKQAGLNDGEIRFTGYVSDGELVRLYSLCTVFVFPSWHEGFGLPALEAMACGAAVIGANASSLPEVIGLEAALFDPFDVTSIASKLAQALEDENFRADLRAHGLRQATRFSWAESAKRAIAAWEQMHSTRDLELQSSAEPWNVIHERLTALHQQLISDISTVVRMDNSLTDADLRQIARCLERNERQLETIARSTELPARSTWRIEGPFDSSYSLALVNREIARALAGLGHNVILHSTEGPGDFAPDQQFLTANRDLAEMHSHAARVTHGASDVASRNLYPPRVTDMQARLNFLHAYGWEESGFPYEWVESFNLSLQGMTVLSDHVRKVMIDNGVTVPISVSGAGIDHWERLLANHRYCLKARKFRFLHVSSCFPRKGADSMLIAYGRAFRSSDDVTLVVKTFSNPHNEIHRWLEEARKGDPDFPDVQIIEGDYSDEDLKALYEQCNVLVAPSRAEGFGLPLAEAMLSGLAVITTGWSGQMDFCTPETAWLVDYSFERAETHLGLFDSVWADPDVAHLKHVMREVYETPQSIRERRILAGRKLLLEKFRWSNAAARMVEAARACALMPKLPEPRIGWITTWNTRCGIATYSEHLVRNMPSQVTMLAAHTDTMTAPDEAGVDRCWIAGGLDSLDGLRQSIERHRLDTVVIQFNYGFFDFQAFAAFLNDQVDSGRVIVLAMHSTTDPTHAPHKQLRTLIPAFSRCHRVLVHAPDDMNRLKQYGLVDNVALFPHGILDYSPPVKQIEAQPNNFVIASYGFFLPHKGLLELIDAVAVLRARGSRVRLRMINAEYPSTESNALIEQASKRIAMHGLADVVFVCTRYLSDSESLAHLAEADLVVFPYQNTGESSSAAVRYGISSGRPVAVTPLAIFDDVEAAVHYLPGQSAEKIADGIAELLQKLVAKEVGVLEKMKSADRWRAAHHYLSISNRLYGMLIALSRLEKPRTVRQHHDKTANATGRSIQRLKTSPRS